jgi:uncharacterized surface protein with fasciclin (FAS1) repeats
MKKGSLLTAGLLGFLGAACSLSAPALAGNSSVESVLESLGDTSMFYQALLNTGVINQLDETGKYTIFAPVNSAFAQIPPAAYPCFYSEACRPQIAVLLRDHILDGTHQLDDLVAYGNGVPTIGPRRVFVNEPFVRDYAVDNQHILSETEANGNIIYRISGVITNPQELAEFRAVPAVPVANTVTERTVVHKVYAPSAAYPGGDMYPGTGDSSAQTPAGTSVTTTIQAQ